MKKDKINLALLWPRYNGNVTSVNDLVLGLDRERFNIIFIYLSGYGVDKNFLQEAGYDVIYLSNIKRLNTFRFSVLFRLTRILKGHNVDIIHCHGHKSTVYGTIAAALAKRPAVMAHVHGLDRSRNFRRKLTNFFLFRRINRIIPVANSVKKDILKNNWFLSAEKLSVLENSIDFSRFADVQISKQQAKESVGLGPNSFVFGTVGRLAPTKGQVYLIGAFARVKQQMPSAHLVFIGDGRLRNELEAQAAKTAPNSIHFLGRRNNIPELLKAMDIFVFPSVAEGFGLALIEAMAAGVPCIASAVGGIPEIITNNETGFLVPPKDEKALAESMIAVAGKPEPQITDIVNRAKELVRTSYTHKEIGKKLEHLYETELRCSANVNG